MPKFYVATRKDRAGDAASIEEALKAHRWERTFVWTERDGADSEENAKIAAAELDGVRKADVLIVLLPDGYGTHVEIGAALALGKPVIIHAPDRKTLETPYTCIFHYHPGVVRLLISEILDVSSIVDVLNATKAG